MRFTDIARVIEQTLERVSVVEPTTLSVVEAVDAEARDVASELVAGVRNQIAG